MGTREQIRKPKKKNSWQRNVSLWAYRLVGLFALLLVSYGAFRLVKLAIGETFTLDDVSGTYINETDPEQYLIIDARGVCKFTRVVQGRYVEGSLAQLTYKLRGKTLSLSLPGASEDPRVGTGERPREYLTKTPIMTIEGSAIVSRSYGRFLRVDPDCFTPSGDIRPGPVKYGEPRSPRATSGRPMARSVNPRLRPALSWTAVSADGSVFVAGQPNGCIGVWDPSTGEALAGWESNFESVQHPALSPDGNRLAFLCGTYLRVMNPRTGEFLNQPVSIAGIHEGGSRESLTHYSLYGEYLIVTTTQGTKVFDGDGVKEMQNLEMGRVGAVALLPEGNTCVALCASRRNSDGRSTLAWCDLDTGSGDHREELPAGREYERLVLSADGKTLALSGYVPQGNDRSLGKGFIQFRRSSDGELLGEIKVESDLGPFGFANSDRSLIVVDRRGLSEWNVSSFELVQQHLEFPVAFFGQTSQATNRLITVVGRSDGGGPRFFELTTGREIAGEQ